MTRAELNELGDRSIERDFNFGVTEERAEDNRGGIAVPSRQATPATQVKLLKVCPKEMLG